MCGAKRGCRLRRVAELQTRVQTGHFSLGEPAKLASTLIDTQVEIELGIKTKRDFSADIHPV